MKSQNQVAVIEEAKVAPFYITGDGVDSMLESIAKEAKSLVPDVKTLKGRKEITSNISKYVTVPKTYFEATGKELSAARKKEPILIDATRKKVKDFLSELQVQLRKPLTEWEDEQKAMKEAKALALMIDDAYELNCAFDEKREMNLQMDHMQAILENSAFDQSVKDALEAELIAERNRQDERVANEKRIAEEAAATAKLEAEKKASDEMERLKDLADAAEKAKKDAEKKASDEMERLKDLADAAEKAKKDSELEAETQRKLAIQADIDLELKLEQDKIDACIAKNLFEEQQAESARLAEVKRVHDIEAARVSEAAKIKRELDAEAARIQAKKRNTEYRTAMKTAMKLSLMAKAGLSEDMAISAVKAIFAGKIDHVEVKI